MINSINRIAKGHLWICNQDHRAARRIAISTGVFQLQKI